MKPSVIEMAFKWKPSDPKVFNNGNIKTARMLEESLKSLTQIHVPLIEWKYSYRGSDCPRI